MNIKLFLTDVDGCLTDGGMYYDEVSGNEFKRYNVYDGAGMVLLQRAGIPCGILTGEDTDIVARRAQRLKLKYLYMGIGSFHPDKPTKRQVAEQICNEMGISMAEVAFVGDDVNDIDLLEAVGYPFCPPNARPEVKAIPGITVLQTPGGQGAIREVCDRILKETE